MRFTARDSLQSQDGVKFWMEEPEEVEKGRDRAFVVLRSKIYEPFRQALAKAPSKRQRKKAARGELEPFQSELIFAKALAAQGFGKDQDGASWGGIYDDADKLELGNGGPVPFSRENVRAFAVAYPEFADYVSARMDEEAEHARSAEDAEGES